MLVAISVASDALVDVTDPEMLAAICAEPDNKPCPSSNATCTSDPEAPAIHLSFVPSHNNDPEAGPSLTWIPPRAAPVPFNARMLSPNSIVVESTVVVVPDTSKLPVTVTLPERVGFVTIPTVMVLSVTVVSISFAVPTTDKASSLRLTESFPVDPDIANVELKLSIVVTREELTASNSVWVALSPSIVVILVLNDPLSVCNAAMSVSLPAISVAIEALRVVSASVANVLTDALTVFNSASEAYVSSNALIEARLVAISVARDALNVVSASVAKVLTDAETAFNWASVA